MNNMKYGDHDGSFKGHSACNLLGAGVESSTVAHLMFIPDISVLYRCLTMDSPIVKEVQGFVVSGMTAGSDT
jgi:hypothetical protein